MHEADPAARSGPDIRIGCCGFPLARGEYFRLFPVVEVQQTFYQPPRLETLSRWRETAPPDFEFTLKAWQLITHEPSSPTYRRLRTPVPEGRRGRYGGFRPTEEVMAAWQTTLEAARVLAATVVLFQCPASFTPTEAHVDDLRRFFTSIRRDAAGLTLAWEPRGAWEREQVLALCRELGLVYAVDPFLNAPPPEGPRYFRLHGIGGWSHRYGDAELRRLLALCRGKTWCLFNNRSMAEDAGRFQQLVGGRA